MPTITVPVDGLHCAGCVDTVTRELGALSGVSSVSVDLNTKGISTVTLQAENDIPDSVVQDALQSEGNFTISR